jgi:hypothetical protein
MAVCEFLPGLDEPETVTLSDAVRDAKARMISCYASQTHVLAGFPLEVERYREAPTYDFTRAPHPGKLFYENFDWGVTGDRWRVLAGEALRTLGAGAAGAGL